MTSTLPDEILFRIIEKYIDDVMRIEQVYVRRNRSELGEKGDAEHALSYKGFPNVMNLLLVNTLFYEETRDAVFDKFDDVRWIIDFDCTPLLVISLPINSYGWLTAMIHDLSISHYRLHSTDIDIKPFLHRERTPNLWRITLTDDEVRAVDFGEVVTAVPPGSDGLRTWLSKGEVSEHLFAENGVADILQSRRIRLTLNVIYLDESSEGLLTAPVFEGKPGRDDDKYEVILKLRWSLMFGGIARWSEDCAVGYTTLG